MKIEFHKVALCSWQEVLGQVSKLDHRAHALGRLPVSVVPDPKDVERAAAGAQAAAAAKTAAKKAARENGGDDGEHIPVFTGVRTTHHNLEALLAGSANEEPVGKRGTVSSSVDAAVFGPPITSFGSPVRAPVVRFQLPEDTNGVDSDHKDNIQNEKKVEKQKEEESECDRTGTDDDGVGDRNSETDHD